MLGANGQTKTYLVMALNNAEPMESGGFVGSSGIMTCTNGPLEMTGFTTIAGQRAYSAAVTNEELATIGEGLAVNPGIATAAPSFTRAAQIYAEEWQHYQGTAVDDVEVNGDNANEVLLHYVYWNYATNEEMDGFYGKTA